MPAVPSLSGHLRAFSIEIRHGQSNQTVDRADAVKLENPKIPSGVLSSYPLPALGGGDSRSEESWWCRSRQSPRLPPSRVLKTHSHSATLDTTDLIQPGSVVLGVSNGVSPRNDFEGLVSFSWCSRDRGKLLRH